MPLTSGYGVVPVAIDVISLRRVVTQVFCCVFIPRSVVVACLKGQRLRADKSRGNEVVDKNLHHTNVVGQADARVPPTFCYEG